MSCSEQNYEVEIMFLSQILDYGCQIQFASLYFYPHFPFRFFAKITRQKELLKHKQKMATVSRVKQMIVFFSFIRCQFSNFFCQKIALSLEMKNITKCLFVENDIL